MITALKSTLRAALLATATTAALSACATMAPGYDNNADKLALYRAHAGEEVSSIPFSGNISNWTALGDSALAVWTGPGRAYLLELGSACPDLEHGYAIGFDSNDRRITADFDSVVVVSEPPPRIPCRIESIRRVDVEALQAAGEA